MIRHILKSLGLLALAAGAWAQAFSSGSTGSDGAYSPTVSGDFDPAALGLNPAGDNVFNFTTINIPAGVTIRLRASKVRNMPVVWLATGNVTIAGTLNLSGDAGYTLDAANPSQIALVRRPAEPGPGGYYGGLGSRGGIGPEPGGGPGGGAAGLNNNLTTCNGGSGSSFNAGNTNYNPGGVGPTYGNAFLVPLYGGSGGGGGWNFSANAVGAGGGAGGGAIRIVSTTQISVTGTINANGGSTGSVSNSSFCYAGSGAGGAIHLIAPTIAGNGALNANSGSVYYGGPHSGLIRLGVTNYNYTGNVSGGGNPGTGNTTNYFIVGPLYNVPANSTSGQPSIVLTQVNGVNVPNPPQGQYLAPDVQINANTPVTVNLTASNIPLGTQPVLRLTSETAGDQSITCAPLAGTLGSSTSTCSATFPFSISIAALRATW